jgi:hypothetical protein
MIWHKQKWIVHWRSDFIGTAASPNAFSSAFLLAQIGGKFIRA